jgi:hypothetical protein
MRCNEMWDDLSRAIGDIDVARGWAAEKTVYTHLIILVRKAVTSLVAVVCAHRLLFSDIHPPNLPKTP